MLFNSLEFLIFFPVVTLLFFLLPHKFRWFHLLIASCVFYSYFIPVYIFILFFTIIIDYYAGIYIENSEGKTRKNFLILSLVANIGILAVFKYYNFFIENFNVLGSSIGLTNRLPYWELILPIGLSFHTFQAMSYTIEVYRGNQKAEKHFGIYALYVMFYPQLVAGPIERPQNILHQFHETKIFNNELFRTGIKLMLWGLFKKVVVADRLAIYVNIIYAHPSHYHYANVLLALIAFSIQIYCDFSGYSDIAIGAARTMGYDLMTNFNRPYLARNIQEFWAKWHISLSTWFRDYLYISLGGNRVGINRMYINVAIVFLISGLWHGASWNFVIWGGIHAICIMVYMFYKSKFNYNVNNKFFNTLSVVLTFSIVTLAWVFFRASDFKSALEVLKSAFNFSSDIKFSEYLKDNQLGFIFNKFSAVIALIYIVFMFFFESRFKPLMNEDSLNPLKEVIFLSFVLASIITMGVFKNNSFIYFQF